MCMKNAFVYQWYDTRTDMLYIGVHKGTFDDGYVCSSDVMLQEYQSRKDDFQRVILAEGEYLDMCALELNLLRSVDAANNSLYYNKTNGGEHFWPCPAPRSEETKKKISAAKTGKPRSEETKRKIRAALMGKTLSVETKQKISVAHSGKTLSENHKQKIREANSGSNHPQYGIPKSDETKHRIRMGNLGKTHTRAPAI